MTSLFFLANNSLEMISGGGGMDNEKFRAMVCQLVSAHGINARVFHAVACDACYCDEQYGVVVELRECSSWRFSRNVFNSLPRDTFILSEPRYRKSLCARYRLVRGLCIRRCLFTTSNACVLSSSVSLPASFCMMIRRQSTSFRFEILKRIRTSAIGRSVWRAFSRGRGLLPYSTLSVCSTIETCRCLLAFYY